MAKPGAQGSARAPRDPHDGRRPTPIGPLGVPSKLPGGSKGAEQSLWRGARWGCLKRFGEETGVSDRGSERSPRCVCVQTCRDSPALATRPSLRERGPWHEASPELAGRAHWGGGGIEHGGRERLSTQAPFQEGKLILRLKWGNRRGRVLIVGARGG